MRKHTHIVIVCVCYFWFAIDVFYSLWQGCDSLNHNSTFEKKNLIFQRKRKKTYQIQIIQQIQCYLQRNNTKKTPKDRSEKHVSNI